MGNQCYSCYVNPGELHKKGCYTEECPNCGGRLYECRCRDNTQPCPKGWINDVFSLRGEEVIGINLNPNWFPPDELRIPWKGE